MDEDNYTVATTLAVVEGNRELPALLDNETDMGDISNKTIRIHSFNGK